MKFFRIVTFFIFLTFFTSCSTTKDSNYQLRKYEEAELSNGLKLLLVKDSSLPYFSMQMMIKTGGVQDPVNRTGLANLVAKLLNKSTKNYSALEIADIIGQMGGEFRASVSDDFTSISSSTLSEHRAQLINTFSEIILTPTFSEVEVQRQKKQVTSEIQKLVDNPQGFASVAYSTFIYGAHPYGRSVLGTIKDIGAIKRSDILNFYDQYYRPNNAILAITGDFDESILQDITKAFSSWKRKPVESVDYPLFPQISGVNIKLIDKTDLAQTQIRIGHKAIKRDNPDYLKLRLASVILGGGFSSRLMTRVRKERGLTYSISSSFGAEKDYGAFTVSTFTRHEKVGETVAETLAVLKRVKDEGISRAELDSAKALIKGTFPRAIETAESFSNNLLLLRLYGIGDDYLRDYYKNIDAINLKDVNSAIEKYLDPDNLKILVYAPKKSTEEQLRPIGKVEVEDFKKFIQ